MSTIFKILLSIFLFITITYVANSQEIIVAKDGTGKFKSIQEAINSLDTFSLKMRTIHIKNGVYNEKIYLEKSFVCLKGESEKGVIISITLPRDTWRCTNPDDYGAATVNVTTRLRCMRHLFA